MRGRSQRGFTLIEVLAAVVLLSFAFAALLGALGRASRLAANADAHTRAALCAQSALDGSFVMTPLHAGITRGRCDDRFSWQLQAQRWQPTNQVPDGTPVRLYRLDLTVSWGQSGRRRHARFSTLRAQMPLSHFHPGTP